VDLTRAARGAAGEVNERCPLRGTSGARVSPPVPEGTTSTGITGDPGPENRGPVLRLDRVAAHLGLRRACQGRRSRRAKRGHPLHARARLHRCRSEQGARHLKHTGQRPGPWVPVKPLILGPNLAAGDTPEDKGRPRGAREPRSKPKLQLWDRAKSAGVAPPLYGVREHRPRCDGSWKGQRRVGVRSGEVREARGRRSSAVAAEAASSWRQGRRRSFRRDSMARASSLHIALAKRRASADLPAREGVRAQGHPRRPLKDE
jgi:hypothetical protein